MNAPDRESTIRTRAYEIWERKGKPADSHEADWQEAAQAIDGEIGEKVSPVSPATSGSPAATVPATPDPFPARRSDVGSVDASSPLPATGGPAEAPKSL